MPWGYECRAKLCRQNKTKPTISRRDRSVYTLPGPLDYETPQLTGGKGYSHIRRAPAYSFRNLTPWMLKPSVSSKAPGLNLAGCTVKGSYKIPYGLMYGEHEFVRGNGIPGPGTYDPHHEMRVKRPPAYSMGHRAKPPYQSGDMWTPPPNMYLPPTMKRKIPAYTMPYNRIVTKIAEEGPRELMPKHEYVKKSIPAYSFGYPHRKRTRIEPRPAMNAYCEKKFMVGKPTAPAPSFGIRHTPYLGKEDLYLKTSQLDLAIRSYDQ